MEQYSIDHRKRKLIKAENRYRNRNKTGAISKNSRLYWYNNWPEKIRDHWKSLKSVVRRPNFEPPINFAGE